jgi:hypothetical protein
MSCHETRMATVTRALDDALLGNARRKADRAGLSLSRSIGALVEAALAAKAAGRVDARDVFLTENLTLRDYDGSAPSRGAMDVRPGLGGHDDLDLPGRNARPGKAGRGAGVVEAARGFEHADRKPTRRDTPSSRGYAKARPVARDCAMGEAGDPRLR